MQFSANNKLVHIVWEILDLPLHTHMKINNIDGRTVTDMMANLCEILYKQFCHNSLIKLAYGEQAT